MGKPGNTLSSQAFHSWFMVCSGYLLSGLRHAIAHIADVVMGFENAVCLALDNGAQVTWKLAGKGLLIILFRPVLTLFNAVQNGLITHSHCRLGLKPYPVQNSRDAAGSVRFVAQPLSFQAELLAKARSLQALLSEICLELRVRSHACRMYVSGFTILAGLNQFF